MQLEFNSTTYISETIQFAIYLGHDYIDSEIEISVILIASSSGRVSMISNLNYDWEISWTMFEW